MESIKKYNIYGVNRKYESDYGRNIDHKIGTPEQPKEELVVTPIAKKYWDEIQKKLKALEIIKEKPIVALVDYKYTYEEWVELVDEKDKDLFKNKEEYDLLKEVLL